MFFGTNPHLLRPIHSLLKAPFDFAAGLSISSKLINHLHTRADFEDLLALGCVFDAAILEIKPLLASLRHQLQDELSHVIPLGVDHSSVCRAEFNGNRPIVLGVDGARYLCHVSVQCQLERLYDYFDLRRSGHRNPLAVDECVKVLQLMMFSEALALSIAGIASVKRDGDQFELTVRSSTEQQWLRNTWFARISDQSSHTATWAIARQLASNGAGHLRDVEVLTERILDQDLAISWRKLTADGRSLRSIQKIYAAASVVALLAVLGMQEKKLKMSGPELSKHGLDFSTVASLISQQGDALVTDQFITRQNDFLSIRIEGASKGLRQLFRAWETEYGERDALRIHVGGLFYEQTHIRQRIELGDDYKTRYRIFDGFDRYKVLGDTPNECDVEFIIQDFQQGHYYFIQVKHALLGERAFLEATVEAIQKDLGKGLHQLREAKRLLECGDLSETLRARGISDANPSNSSFVLLHNIAQLDFQASSDGISLYDWASFRNLLKDAECYYGHSDEQGQLVRLPTPLIVSAPADVIHRLLSEHAAYKQTFNDPWAPERATTSYKILGKTISVCGLGI